MVVELLREYLPILMFFAVAVGLSAAMIIASRADGTVWRVDKKVGDRVTAGEVLALVDAAEVGRAKAELLQAVAELHLHDKTIQRLADLEGIVAGKRLLEAEAARTKAEAAVRKSVQTLHNLGLPIALEDVRQQANVELTKTLHFLGLPQSVSAPDDAPSSDSGR